MKPNEQLFLLEILIERIVLRRSIAEQIYPTRDTALPLSVKVKFINISQIEIDQEEFQDHEGLTAASVGDFSTGKSCLFPMEPSELLKAIKKSPLRTELMRKTEGTCPPEILGSTEIFLTSEMYKMVRQAMVSNEEMPISSILQDSYNLRNDKQEDVGFISVFIRLSCYGQSIVTQFKLVKETNSFLFKNSKESTLLESQHCLCGTDNQSGPSGEQKSPSTGNLQDQSCECSDCCTQDTQKRQTSRSRDCDSVICETTEYVEIPETDPQTCVSSENSPTYKVCGAPRPCRTCEKIQPKSSESEPLYPCGICGASSQIKGKAAEPACPCGRCGHSAITKAKDCGPTYPCAGCGPSAQNKSKDCGPTNPCKMCSSIPQEIKSDDCGPIYPCGVCRSSSKQSSKDSGLLCPRRTCGTAKDQKGENQRLCSKCFQKRLNSHSRPKRQPFISCDECGIIKTSQCPGEKETCDLPYCECGDYIDELEDNCYDDKVCDICSECFDILRPPFSERAEDDIVPVMPQYCSQDNIYDPELDQKTCPSKLQKKTEKWQEMLKCKCSNEHLTELYEKLQSENAHKPVNPAIRYDTTSCLSPAFGGKFEPEELVTNPNVRYDTSGLLSAAYNHPPVRYDTTGALSSAYQGDDPSQVVCSGLREMESTPGMIESTATESAFRGIGVEKKTYSDALVAVMAKRRKRHRCWRPPAKSHKRYGYTWGGTYPGMKIGHRFCLEPSESVPARMGWKWDEPIIGLKVNINKMFIY